MARIDECQSFLVEGRCHRWIIENFDSGKYPGGADHPEKEQIEKADQICSECPNFKKRLLLNHTPLLISFLGKESSLPPHDIHNPLWINPV